MRSAKCDLRNEQQREKREESRERREKREESREGRAQREARRERQEGTGHSAGPGIAPHRPSVSASVALSGGQHSPPIVAACGRQRTSVGITRAEVLRPRAQVGQQPLLQQMRHRSALLRRTEAAAWKLETKSFSITELAGVRGGLRQGRYTS